MSPLLVWSLAGVGLLVLAGLMFWLILYVATVAANNALEKRRREEERVLRGFQERQRAPVLPPTPPTRPTPPTPPIFNSMGSAFNEMTRQIHEMLGPSPTGNFTRRVVTRTEIRRPGQPPEVREETREEPAPPPAKKAAHVEEPSGTRFDRIDRDDLGGTGEG